MRLRPLIFRERRKGPLYSYQRQLRSHHKRTEVVVERERAWAKTSGRWKPRRSQEAHSQHTLAVSCFSETERMSSLGCSPLRELPRDDELALVALLQACEHPQ